MKKYKIVLSVVLLAAALFGFYAAFTYIYTERMFAPEHLLTTPYMQADESARWDGRTSAAVLLHKTNTPRRARVKENGFDGFETDLIARADGSLAAAHDEHAPQTAPEEIFSALQNPQNKIWWIDLKSDLTAGQLDYFLTTTRAAGIPDENLFFEAAPGPAAKLIKKRKLGLLLQLPAGFTDDGRSPERRKQINENFLKLWKEYQPAAVAASFGKYQTLKTYFPNLPKAVYYSSTKRPSLKKTFMTRNMKKDPSVKIFLLDEYTFLPF